MLKSIITTGHTRTRIIKNGRGHTHDGATPLMIYLTESGAKFIKTTEFTAIKMDKQDEKLLDYCLNEIKDQYKIFLEGFDDIKKKNQILLVICSLIITLPLSNENMVNKIMLSIYSSGIFIAGVICLIISVLLLILSMRDTPVNIPYFNDIFNSVGKYKSPNVKRAIIKTYSEDLEAVRVK